MSLFARAQLRICLARRGLLARQSFKTYLISAFPLVIHDFRALRRKRFAYLVQEGFYGVSRVKDKRDFLLLVVVMRSAHRALSVGAAFWRQSATRSRLIAVLHIAARTSRRVLALAKNVIRQVFRMSLNIKIWVSVPISVEQTRRAECVTSRIH